VKNQLGGPFVRKPKMTEPVALERQYKSYR